MPVRQEKSKIAMKSPRAHDVSVKLRALANQRGPEAKLPTLRELSKSFAVSQTTVIDALDQLERQNVVYRKDRSGIYVSPLLHHKNVRVFFNSDRITGFGHSPFWGILCGLLIREARRRSEQAKMTIEFETLPAESFYRMMTGGELLDMFEDGRAHGMISVGMGNSDRTLWPFGEEMPFVTYGGQGFWFVNANTLQAGVMAVDALVAEGCRRIALVHQLTFHELDQLDESEYIADTREKYIQSGAAPDDGLLADHALVRRAVLELGREFGAPELPFQDQGYLAARVFFGAHGAKPDGLFLADDMIAQGVLTAFGEMGISAGRDVQMASVTNSGSRVLYGHERALIRVEYDLPNMASVIFDVLDTLMAGGVPSAATTLLSPTLIQPSGPARHDRMLAALEKVR
jgi:DNA-binding LacI/PurR family transcriptional regulator